MARKVQVILSDDLDESNDVDEAVLPSLSSKNYEVDLLEALTGEGKDSSGDARRDHIVSDSEGHRWPSASPAATATTSPS